MIISVYEIVNCGLLYQSLDISDIDHPNIPRLFSIRNGHLFPCLLQLNSVDPFVAARRTDEIKMLEQKLSQGKQLTSDYSRT
jgi:hypothetical protein